MKFLFLENAALVDYIVRCNLRGAVQPEALQAFCERWRLYMLTEQYQEAQKASEKREPGQARRSKKIWMLKQKIERGKWIADWIAEDRTNCYLIGRSDQAIYEEYIANAIQNELDDVLRTPAGDRNPGAGSSVTRM